MILIVPACLSNLPSLGTAGLSGWDDLGTEGSLGFHLVIPGLSVEVGKPCRETQTHHCTYRLTQEVHTRRGQEEAEPVVHRPGARFHDLTPKKKENTYIIKLS